MRRLFVLLLALGVWTFAAGPLGALAQGTGSIAGSVRAADGSPVAGATVSLAGPVTQTVGTDAEGRYSAGALPPGTYRLTVTHSGYATAQDIEVVVGAGAAPLDVTLQPASLTTIQHIGSTGTTSRATRINTSPAAVNVIDASTLRDRGQLQVQNVLEETPGVELQRFSSGGAPGANTTVAIRGADSYETQTLIDGHPVNGGSFGSFLIQFLNPLVLDDIEVSKGPGTFGNTIANAVGGTANFRTPTITRNPTGLASVGYDSYDGSSLAFRYSQTFGKVGFLVGYARGGTPGYFSNRPILYVNPDSAAKFGQIPNATVNMGIPAGETFDNKSEVVKLGYDLSKTTNLTLGYYGSHTFVDYTGTLTTVEPVHIVAGPCAGCGAFGGNSGMPSYTNPQFGNLVGSTVLASTVQDTLFLGNFENDNQPIFSGDLRTAIGNGTFLARYYAGAINRLINDPAEVNQILQCDDPTCDFGIAQANGDTSGPFYQKELDILHGGDLEFDLPVGDNAYTVSFDTHGDRTTKCSGSDPLFRRGCSIPSLLQNSSTISLRANFALGTATRLQVANYFSNTTNVGSRYDPRLALTFRPRPNLVLRASAGSSYVPPFAAIFPALAGRTLNVVAPNLAPETSFSLDAGGDLALGRDARATLDVYDTRIRNRFATIFGFGVGGTFQGSNYSNTQFTYNQANTRDAGIEATYVKQPRSGFGGVLTADLSRAYAYGSNFLDTPLGAKFTPGQQGNYGIGADGSQLVGYPYFHGRAELSYTFPHGATFAFGSTIYGAVNSFNEPGFALFDVRVATPVNNGMRLIVSAQNLFNHDDYRTLGQFAYGYAPPQDAAAVAAGIANSFNPQTLYFAPPRQITIQLTRSFGRP